MFEQEDDEATEETSLQRRVAHAKGRKSGAPGIADCSPHAGLEAEKAVEAAASDGHGGQSQAITAGNG